MGRPAHRWWPGLPRRALRQLAAVGMGQGAAHPPIAVRPGRLRGAAHVEFEQRAAVGLAGVVLERGRALLEGPTRERAVPGVVAAEFSRVEQADDLEVM